MKNKAIAITLACVAALVWATPSSAASINIYNTGVNGAGAVLPDGTLGDPHYSLIGVPGGTTDIRIITSASGFPIGPYLGDNSLSRWIGPNNDSDLNGLPGTYTYRTTFNIGSSYNLASAALTGGWSSDNDGVSIILNGVNTLIPPTSFAQFQNGFSPFSITSGFVFGVNTLDFVVHNGGTAPGNNSGGANPTALRVQVTGTVPDGGVTLVLLGGALLGIAAIRRRFNA